MKPTQDCYNEITAATTVADRIAIAKALYADRATSRNMPDTWQVAQIVVAAMPALTGVSERQIAYGVDLRAEAILDAWRATCQATLRGQRLHHSNATVLDILALFVGCAAEDSAKAWIEGAGKKAMQAALTARKDDIFALLGIK